VFALAKACEQKGVDWLLEERSFGLLAVFVHGVAHQVETLDGISKKFVILVVAMAEKQKLQVLKELFLVTFLGEG
jgi:hypothetical protein